jgi:outer membrane immunogenic protein
MMKKLFLSTVSIGSIVAASHAGAADLPVKAPMAPVEAAYRWTGFYLGGTISSVSSTMSTGAFPYQTATGLGDVYDFGYGDATQAAIGGVLGYNYQMGRTVIGIEGDVNYKYGKGLFAPLDALMQSNWDGSIRGRLGFTLTPAMLLYATGGVAFGQFSTRGARGAPVWAGTTVGTRSSYFGDPELLGGTRVGWTVGGGVEYGLDSHWSTKIEYRYTDWGSKTVSWSAGADDTSFAPFVGSTSTKLFDHRVILGLNYNFNGTDPVVAASPRWTKAPVRPVAVYSWTGFYAGLQVGTVASQMHVGDTVASETSNFATSLDASNISQTLVGLHVGYDYQVNDRIVVGVEGDISHKAGGGVIDQMGLKNLVVSDYDGSIRGRLGYLITPKALAYVTGGFAFGHFKTPWHEDPVDPSDPGDLTELAGGSRTGWTVGGGLQYLLDSNWSTRLEARYTNWGSKDVNVAPAVDAPISARSTISDVRVLTGLTYKFGGSPLPGERDTVVANWNGVYLGGQIGYSAAKFDFGGVDDVSNEFARFQNSFIGGVFGYNYMFRTNNTAILLGVEGDLNAKVGHGYKINDWLRARSTYDGSIRARLGFAPTARSMVYATGGWAWGFFETPSTGGDTCGGDPTCINYLEEHLGGLRTGWTVGGGIEYALDDKWSSRIDYRYTNWGTKLVNDNIDLQYSKLIDERVSIGVSYRFGDGPIVAKY